MLKDETTFKKKLMMEKRGEDEKSTMGTLLCFKFTITFLSCPVLQWHIVGEGIVITHHSS